MAVGGVLPQARAILWAQIRTLRNFYPRGNLSRTLATWTLAGIWYGLWTFGAIAAGVLLADTHETERLALLLSNGLLAAMMYWQLIPVLMISAGASLDLNRLRIYPIPSSQLFGIEVMLRMTSAVEMLLVVSGATVGLLANPVLPAWAAAPLAPFAVMNLLLSAGLRHLLGRLLARKHVREITFLVLVSLAALPQVLLIFGVPPSVKQYVTSPPEPWWPWSAGAAAILGERFPLPWLVLIGWTLIAYAFARWQFERSLAFDLGAAAVRVAPPRPLVAALDRVFRAPGVVLRDPLAALLEKEIRTLTRSPRFRVVFIMGFTFGLIIWLPLTLHGDYAHGFFGENYLTFVSLYALLLLGEVTFWNSFGFDRGAASIYFLPGAPLSQALAAKNIAALIFVLLEVAAVAIACGALAMPLTVRQIAECFAVTLVLAVYMLAVGNYGSVNYPRPVDPRQSWRTTSASRFQAMLLLVYPVIALPVAVAFLARWALDSEAAFWLVLGCAGAAGLLLYRFSFALSVKTLRLRRESFLDALAVSQGPVMT